MSVCLSLSLSLSLTSLPFLMVDDDDVQQERLFCKIYENLCTVCLCLFLSLLSLNLTNKTLTNKINVQDTPFEGGLYHGVITFPKEYPWKPPAIKMLTPTGKFEVGRDICLSISAHHPETWNPLWSVKSMLIGLLSFMCDKTSKGKFKKATIKRELAKKSLSHNLKNEMFCKLFPEFVKIGTPKAVVTTSSSSSSIEKKRRRIK